MMWTLTLSLTGYVGFTKVLKPVPVSAPSSMRWEATWKQTEPGKPWEVVLVTHPSGFSLWRMGTTTTPGNKTPSKTGWARYHARQKLLTSAVEFSDTLSPTPGAQTQLDEAGEMVLLAKCLQQQQPRHKHLDFDP